MRNISEVLQEKLAQIERVKHEISVLREAIPLLLDAPDTTAEMIAQFRTAYKKYNAEREKNPTPQTVKSAADSKLRQRSRQDGT